MKKFIALVLILVSLLSVVSCDRGGDKKVPYLEQFEQYFASSIPTKSETHIINKYSSIKLVSDITLVTGTIDGKAASQLLSNVQTLKVLSPDDKILNLEPYKTEKKDYRYLEGKGLSTNGGRRWDSEGTDFAPQAGSVALDLNPDNFTDTSYDEETGVLVLTVSADKASTVLAKFIAEGQSFSTDATVTVTAAGGRISSIKIEYIGEEYEIGEMGSEIEIEEVKVTITANYSYDIQDITFD